MAHWVVTNADRGQSADGLVERESRCDKYSCTMARLLGVWIAFVAVLTFITVPWLKAGNGGDFTTATAWFYHAIMLPSALLFLILCTRVFATHFWVRYLVSHSALVALFEGVGFLILGYGDLHNIASLSAFGLWIVMPCTIELFAVTLIFVVDLAVSAFFPPSGEKMEGQKAEIHWALFFSGVSVLTWVVMGILAAASVVGISWSFWAGWQHESTATLMGNILTSHSHGMLPAFMAAIVFLAAEAFGYSRLAGIRKQVARVGVGIMLAGIALFSGIYAISAIGTFVIPAWFPYGAGGANGLAMDDTMTGLVGLGALILAADMLPEMWGSFRRATGVVKNRFNPVRLAVYLTYLMASVVLFLYGYYIEFNETKFGFGSMPASLAMDDEIFSRAHLLLAFGSLPVIAVFLLAAELFGNTSRMGETLKRSMAGIVLVGMLVAVAGLGIWVFSTPGHATSWDLASVGGILYMVGQGFIIAGAIVELFATGGSGVGEIAETRPAPAVEPQHAAPPAPAPQVVHATHAARTGGGSRPDGLSPSNGTS